MEIRKVGSAEVLQHTELIREYAAECSIPDIGPIDPQREMYAFMERARVNQWFGAFHEDKLIGIASVLTAVLPHYGRKTATVESLFVEKAHRASDAGRLLMHAVEKYAKAENCSAILYSAPTGGQLERLLSLKRDYRQTNTVFCRGL